MVQLGFIVLLLSACADMPEISQSALPAGYALMPGDEALWQRLTEAEQRRALAFLSDGSTIRSSLAGDY
ncbi:hypothetical protein [Pseudophaeobacter leonis]|uniref:hypothetical protein n=1 Tax=Pseudophaeobacter leonis TaxID=1144477 RepID=UPI00111BEE42|nr:hypothetical protein [Pseudophaeobacter leonis]